ncbi:MAG: hypothetical protein MUF21_03735 [Gemmatimonadaceae bacterium]|jgi:hypothetical protein|nr:hypothetical protein [Gemmatimonadaceae bacterium]
MAEIPIERVPAARLRGWLPMVLALLVLALLVALLLGRRAEQPASSGGLVSPAAAVRA